MHETFKLYICICPDLPDLFKIELPCKNNPAEACIFKELHLFGGSIVHLGACNQGNGWKIKLQKPWILENQPVGSGLIYRPNDIFSLGHLLICKNSVKGKVNPCIEKMGIINKPGNLFQTVSGIGPCTELRGSYINGISTVVNGSPACIHISGRRQQLQGDSLIFNHDSHFHMESVSKNRPLSLTILQNRS